MMANFKAAFEGHAHPHKGNILQYPGQNVQSIQSITDIPEVKSRISQAGAAK